ncbi:MAG: methionyl-tRNA formyltransferase [Candidatus Taylorbacteria bacterium]|nr:methionyl-tRNA formyltransferase [Candidatus Taylorbacteria bacterium]
MSTKHNIAFFGTPDRAVWTLDILHASGFTPAVIITQPDKPQGRKLVLTPPPAKVWAQEHNIPVLQPQKLDEGFSAELLKYEIELSVVIAYGKIIPKSILDIPKHGTLNIHGSLLPKYRGASPIESAILNDDKDTGVSIILMDEQMDHGPIIAEEKVSNVNWPPTADELAREIVSTGAKRLVSIIPDWILGKITPKTQEHDQATFTKKISKEDGHIDLQDDPYKNILKIQAYQGWPGTFFFSAKNNTNTRIKITQARFENSKLIIEKVIPEGKKEMSYEEFTKNLN